MSGSARPHTLQQAIALFALNFFGVNSDLRWHRGWRDIGLYWWWWWWNLEITLRGGRDDGGGSRWRNYGKLQSLIRFKQIGTMNRVWCLSEVEGQTLGLLTLTTVRR